MKRWPKGYLLDEFDELAELLLVHEGIFVGVDDQDFHNKNGYVCRSCKIFLIKVVKMA